jgi:four helix bundle protein
MKTELEERTRKFAVQVVKTVAAFPKSSEGQIIGKQLLRSGTSIGANYREANRAESRNDFVHKVGVAEKETAETIYWLEICRDTKLGSEKSISVLLDEASQLLAILITIGRKAKNKS